jgi:Chromo (CHRromatin Organisation MOdifier) domain
VHVHPVFRVSLLKPFHRGSDEGREQPPPPPVVVDGEEEYQVERLLDVRKVRRGLGYHQEFLVKWSGYGHEHNSWEPLAHSNENYQDDVDRLLAERQVASSSKHVRAGGRQKKSAPALNLIQLNKALDQVQLEIRRLTEHLEEVA